MSETIIGVDISKDRLDCHRLPDQETLSLANNVAGWRALIRWIGDAPVARVVFEATGAYHRGFERALAKAGLPLCKINPRQVRRFAEALGRHAKTDAVDAAILARFGLAMEPQPRPVRSEAIEQARELSVARQALIKDRTAALNRQKQAAQPIIKKQIARRLKQIKADIDAIDKALAERIEHDELLRQRRDILLSIPGIGWAAALALLIDMPELGTLDPKQAAALAGLAP